VRLAVPLEAEADDRADDRTRSRGAWRRGVAVISIGGRRSASSTVVLQSESPRACAIGRQVPRLFVEAGLSDVQTAPHVITGDPRAFRLQLAHRGSELRHHGAITAERASQWWSAIRAAASAGHFTGGITAFVVRGTVDRREADG
jgi:hypothetical protein